MYTCVFVLRIEALTVSESMCVCESSGCVGYWWHTCTCVQHVVICMISEMAALPNTTICKASQSKQFLKNSEVTCTRPFMRCTAGVNLHNLSESIYKVSICPHMTESWKMTCFSDCVKSIITSYTVSFFYSFRQSTSSNFLHGHLPAIYKY